MSRRAFNYFQKLAFSIPGMNQLFQHFRNWNSLYLKELNTKILYLNKFLGECISISFPSVIKRLFFFHKDYYYFFCNHARNMWFEFSIPRISKSLKNLIKTVFFSIIMCKKYEILVITAIKIVFLYILRFFYLLKHKMTRFHLFSLFNGLKSLNILNTTHTGKLKKNYENPSHKTFYIKIFKVFI